MNELPQMPTPNVSAQASSEDVSKSVETGAQAPVSSSDLNVPSHDETPAIVPPKYEDANTQSSNEVEVKKPSGMIKVVATRKGFYNNNRIREGQDFYIRSFEDLGEWMKCVDSEIEKKRVAFFAEKKRKQKENVKARA